MKLEFYNCPSPADISTAKLPETPEFVKYKPDFDAIKKTVNQFQKYQNILILGHGGSITSFYGFYNALIEKAKKKAYFLSTVDPDYIFELKKELSPLNTLVIAISKSGETTTQIEALMHFLDYPILMITGKSSALRAIGEKLGVNIVMHPTIGGRYTGFTEVSLVPAALCGFNVEELYEGAKTFFHNYNRENLAWRAASVFHQLEQKGYVDVFMPFYSHGLFALSNVIVQLCHESFGKSGKGQTYFAHEAPESQHHTNQRFFGGPKNIAGFFLSAAHPNHPSQTIIPHSLHSLQLKGRALFDLNKIPLEKSLEFEIQGTLEDAKIQGIPACHLELANKTEHNLGALLAFWQLYAVYASVLREVDPFDQPQVENSKNISFHKRLAFKGLL